ncbi:unnamed protein product [Nezara viridula]|uniref:BZIP domain-containing protein n=1 Tax=Nezara viridula TaxID=85310 RepID=A0A9P0HMY0_NEZVI|nr:unnamed protein product [Nezara viridula]
MGFQDRPAHAPQNPTLSSCPPGTVQSVPLLLPVSVDFKSSEASSLFNGFRETANRADTTKRPPCPKKQINGEAEIGTVGAGTASRKCQYLPPSSALEHPLRIDKMFSNTPMSYSYPSASDGNRVLDLRVYKQGEVVPGQLTPPRDGSPISGAGSPAPVVTPGSVGSPIPGGTPVSVGSPVPVGSPVSLTPTIAITQRVLAAAQAQHTRPFKAYPKDPLTLSTAQDESYIRFRDEMLSQVKGGKTCQRKRPASPQESLDSRQDHSEEKDAAYWERRRKNNEAAKRSRDARRAKEDEIAIRAAFLEQENLKLKYQIAVLSEETAHLRCMVYKADHHPAVLARYPPMI